MAAALLSSLSSLSGAVVPTLFKVLEQNEPEIEAQIVDTMKRIKSSNPSEYALFLENWRKLNRAIEASSIEQSTTPIAAPAPIMTGGVDTPTGPTGPAPAPVPFVEPTPPMVESTGPTGPEMPISETTGPSFLSSTGPTGPAEPSSIITRLGEGIDNLLKSNATGSTGGKKHRKRKTAKQHRKRTHRVKHRKH